MGFLSLSDIIISATLIINAGALLATKPLQLNTEQGSMEEKESLVATDPENTLKGSEDGANSQSQPKISIAERISFLLYGLRKFSCVIVMWNAVFFILMLFVFGS